MQKKKKQPRKSARNISKKKLYSALLLCIIGVMLFRGAMQIPQIIDNKKEAEQLRKQIAYEKERQDEIDELTSKADTDEYIKKNAKIFIDTSSEE